ncbi:protein of unknown function [Bartonella clarridgeiae 73]|uniref:Uncharacterized protein n=1 Tax=Bartonella clarridgeiae (strain CCUG 45776 / CIP 104772 / 73) TaxID=696125 RepID=E6YI98_BARC7|nr:protein of unknown function [Bartonella clarridgeiae 73]
MVFLSYTKKRLYAGDIKFTGEQKITLKKLKFLNDFYSYANSNNEGLYSLKSIL